MNVLKTMTGATPETRLMLLQWAYQNVGRAVIGDMQYLSALFQIPKRMVANGLHYLVQEGYMAKLPNINVTDSKTKHGPRFQFQLTSEGYRLCINTLDACDFREELGHVLFDKSLKLPRQGIRLQWACLVLLANKAGYVIGYGSQVFKQMSGLTDKQLRQNMTFLQKNGVASVVAAEVATSALFDDFPPIYQFHSHSAALSCVNFGVPVQQDHLKKFKFLSDVTSFNHKFQRRIKPVLVPLQFSVLDDERYLELSKGFLDVKLRVYVHHLCISTVLSWVFHETVLSMSRDQNHRNVLQKLIRNNLAQGLGVQGHLSVVPIDMSSNIDEQKPVEDPTIELINYVLDTLTEELMFKILELSQYSKIFTQIYGSPQRLIGWLPEHFMFAKPTTFVSEVEGEGEQSSSQTAQLYDKVEMFTTFVLKVWQPVSIDAKDSMVFGDEIMTNNSRLNNPKLIQVNEILSLKSFQN